MPQHLKELRNSWHRMWPGVGAAADGTATFARLVAYYSEPERKYHSLQHLHECIACFESASHLAIRPAEVEAALWFHDAIYRPGAADNEQQSANWAKAALDAAEVPDDAVIRVTQLVLATRHVTTPTSPDGQLIADIDLSILAASEARFAEYEVQIRDEYSVVEASVFRRKRLEILQSFPPWRRFATCRIADLESAGASTVNTRSRPPAMGSYPYY
jgi:predicted metal-dependent HD superfamily phosphohydrolase